MNASISIRVWLDDVRDAPDGWTRVRTAREAIALLEAGDVVEISLDHDLGDDEANGTGYANLRVDRGGSRHARVRAADHRDPFREQRWATANAARDRIDRAASVREVAVITTQETTEVVA